MEVEGGIVTMKKAEIDTSAPFRSVKEAVMLFGERVLASEVYANKFKETHEASSDDDEDPSRLGLVKAELEETKESLQKAREESMVMATCLSSLEEELEKTKRELQQLKQRESEKQVINPETEDLKFIEDSPSCQLRTESLSREKYEFQKKRYVTFANQPSISQVIAPPPPSFDGAVLKRHPSLKKKKKKSLIPLIGGIFSRKKGSSEIA